MFAAAIIIIIIIIAILTTITITATAHRATEKLDFRCREIFGKMDLVLQRRCSLLQLLQVRGRQPKHSSSSSPLQRPVAPIQNQPQKRKNNNSNSNSKTVVGSLACFNFK